MLKRKASSEDGRFAELALTHRAERHSESSMRLSINKRIVSWGVFRMRIAPCHRPMQRFENVMVTPHQAPRMCVLRQHRPGDMGLVVSREGAVYAEQFVGSDVRSSCGAYCGRPSSQISIPIANAAGSLRKTAKYGTTVSGKHPEELGRPTSSPPVRARRAWDGPWQHPGE